MSLLVVGLIGAFIAWRLMKRRRAAVLAGLNPVKPTFTVEPPTRRVGSRKTEGL